VIRDNVDDNNNKNLRVRYITDICSRGLYFAICFVMRRATGFLATLRIAVHDTTSYSCVPLTSVCSRRLLHYTCSHNIVFYINITIIVLRNAASNDVECKTFNFQGRLAWTRNGIYRKCHHSVLCNSFTPCETIFIALTLWIKVLLYKLIVSQLVKKFAAFYRTRRFITVFITALHWSLP
jgi:hypothetical protein